MAKHGRTLLHVTVTWSDINYVYNAAQGIIELILSTDMAKHGEIMNKYSTVLNTGFDRENEEHVQLVSWTKSHDYLVESE